MIVESEIGDFNSTQATNVDGITETTSEQKKQFVQSGTLKLTHVKSTSQDSKGTAVDTARGSHRSDDESAAKCDMLITPETVEFP